MELCTSQKGTTFFIWNMYINPVGKLLVLNHSHSSGEEFLQQGGLRWLTLHSHQSCTNIKI